MIGSFWNLCRACPSMPVDKLHTEYRSTYRWHEYTGPRQQVVRRPPQGTVAGVPTSAPAAATTTAAAAAAAAGATSSRAVPNRSAEEDTGDGTMAAPRFEPALPRRKKHPELAYRTHEFLAMSEAVGSDNSLDSSQAFQRARSEDRAGERIRSSRRSQSEGRRTDHRLHYMKEIASPPTRRLTKLRTGSDPNETDANEQMFAWPAGAGAGAAVRGGRGRGAAGTRTGELAKMAVAAVPRKSLSMGAIRQGQHPAPVHSFRKKYIDFNRAPDEVPFDLDIEVPIESSLDVPTGIEAEDMRGEDKIRNENVGKEDKPRQRKEFKTEYKKKFRPFSQYDYVEGKFQKKREKNEMSLPLVMSELSLSDSWYSEVIELRKKAGEYKHRGWGTELVPQHIAQLYSKQMTLWEQVSRRSSLAALSLASTTPRAITKEEKEKENNKKSSPSKPMHHLVFTRPTTAQDKSLSEKKKEKSVIEKDGKKGGPRSRQEFLVRHHLDRTTGSMDGALLPSPSREKLEPIVTTRQKEDKLPKSPQKASPKSSPRSARSQSVGPGISNASDRRSPKRQTRATSAAQAVPASKTAVTAPKTASAPKPAVTAGPPVPPVERRPRPSGTDLSPAGEDVDLGSLADASAAMTKAHPEPTRVKSPEQILMRSPEPVNWTVPLDTGKTFTVTQNVRQGDFAGRPHSEVKAWTPPAVPPPAPLSAPPQLPQDWKSPALEDLTSVNGLYGQHLEGEEGVVPQPTSVAGTTLRCLEDPSVQMCGYGMPAAPLAAPLVPADAHPAQAPYRILEALSPSSTANRSMASDVLDKARTRFDNFWGKSKDDKDGGV